MTEEFSPRFEFTTAAIMVFPRVYRADFKPIGGGKKADKKSFDASFILTLDHPDLDSVLTKLLTVARDGEKTAAGYARALANHQAAPITANAKLSVLLHLANEITLPLVNGTEVADKAKAEKKDREFFRGKLRLSAGNDEEHPPVLVGIENGMVTTYDTEDGRKLAEKNNRFYSGAEAFPTVKFFSYQYANNRPGVKAYLQEIFVNGKGAKMNIGVDRQEKYGRHVGHVSNVNPMAGPPAGDPRFSGATDVI